jgi:hypothetical protein
MFKHPFTKEKEMLLVLTKSGLIQPLNFLEKRKPKVWLIKIFICILVRKFQLLKVHLELAKEKMHSNLHTNLSRIAKIYQHGQTKKKFINFREYS